jgi:tetratricopeptide (TPR) repeat protein
MEMGRDNDAVEHLKEAIKIIPNFGPVHLSMGICFAELGRYNEALGKIQDALNFDKNLTGQAHYDFGEVYSKLKNTKNSIKHYKQAISVDPTASMPNLRLGMFYFKLKKFEDCIVPLRRAIKHSPKHGAEGYFKLGAALM